MAAAGTIAAGVASCARDRDEHTSSSAAASVAASFPVGDSSWGPVRGRTLGVTYGGGVYAALWVRQDGALVATRLSPVDATPLDPEGVVLESPPADAGAWPGEGTIVFDGTSFRVFFVAMGTLSSATFTPAGAKQGATVALRSDVAGTSAACALTGRCFVAWKKGADVFVDRVDPTGATLDTTPALVANDTMGHVVSFENGEFVLRWLVGGYAPVPGEVWSRRIDPAGVMGSANKLADIGDGISTIKVASNATEVLVAWASSVNGLSVDFRRYKADGTPIDPASITLSAGVNSVAGASSGFLFGQYLDARFFSSAGQVTVLGYYADGDALFSYPYVASDGQTFVAVSDTWLGNALHGLSALHLDSVGKPTDAGHCIAHSANLPFQSNPAVVWNGSGFLSAWDDDRVGAGSAQIRGTRVSPSGGVLDDPSLPIVTDGLADHHAALAWNGSTYLVAWRHFISQDLAEVRVLLLDPQGTPVGSPMVLESSVYPTIGIPRVAAAPGGDFLVTWNDSARPSGGERLSWKRVSAAGVVLDANPTRITSLDDTWDHEVVWTGTSFLAIFGEWSAVTGVWIGTNGHRLAAPVVIHPQSPMYMSVACHAGECLVAWDNQFDHTVSMRRVGQSGGMIDATTTLPFKRVEQVVWDGKAYAILESETGDLLAHWVDAAGFLWATPPVDLTPGGIAERSFAAASDGAGGTFFTFHRVSDGRLWGGMLTNEGPPPDAGEAGADAQTDAADGATDAPTDALGDASTDAPGDASIDAPTDAVASNDTGTDAQDAVADAGSDAHDAAIDARDGSADAADAHSADPGDASHSESPPVTEDGCACRAAPARGSSGGGFAMALGVAIAAARRKRRGARDEAQSRYAVEPTLHT
jgi:MYXO-CTERM domain-containing protein